MNQKGKQKRMDLDVNHVLIREVQGMLQRYRSMHEGKEVECTASETIEEGLHVLRQVLKSKLP